MTGKKRVATSILALITLTAGIAIALDLVTVVDAGSTVRMVVTDGGSVGMGTPTPNPKAALDIVSVTKGLLPPRMTQVQRDAIVAPPAGLQVFNTTTMTMDFFDGTAWVSVGDPAPIFVSGTVSASTQLTLIYTAVNGLDITSTPANGDYGIVNVGTGGPQTVNNVVVLAGLVQLTLTPGVNAGDVVTVSYTPNVDPVRDSVSQKPAAALVNEPVANSSWLVDTDGTLSTDLVGYWRLDEVAGTRADYLGANDLTDVNTVTSDPGKQGLAAHMAPNEYLTHLDNATFSMGDIDFSLACWVNMDVIGTNRAIAGKVHLSQGSNATDFEYFIDYDNGNKRFLFFVSDGVTATNVKANNLGAPAIGTWYFIVAWHDAANNLINISVNDGAPNSASWSNGVWDGPLNFSLGMGGSANYDGLIDEVGLWKKKLSAQERTDLYNGGLGNTP